MLSKEVKAEIYGTLSERNGVYSGYITSDTASGHNVYILSRKPLKDFVYGIVTAVITLPDGSEKYVVAQKFEIMYEPEIRQRLSAVKSLKIEKLSCLYEKSCGAVILYKEKGADEASILLVKNQKGRFWSFPKGHVELWENEKETAVREIKEETDLDVEVGDFAEAIQNDYQHKRTVQIMMYLCDITGEVKISDEHTEWMWASIEKLKSLEISTSLDKVLKKRNWDI